MKENQTNTHEDLDIDAISATINNDSADDETLKAASNRVWTKISAEMDRMETEQKIMNRCEDMQAMIPEYVDGTLPEGKALLLRDHTKGCAACHKVLQTAKSPQILPPEKEANLSRRISPALFALAAVLLLAVGVNWMRPESMDTRSWKMQATLLQGKVLSTLEDGQPLFEQADTLPLNTVIKTARLDGASFKMKNGAQVELRPRTSFKLSENRGEALRLDHGGVIVEAPELETNQLVVSTRDCVVTANNNTFVVNHTVSGSEVTALKGIVTVQHKGDITQLASGEQWRAGGKSRQSIASAFAWSRNAETYEQLLSPTVMAANMSQATQSMRFESGLIRLLPASTGFYAAMPPQIADVNQEMHLLDSLIENYGILGDWWNHKDTRAIFRPLLASNLLLANLSTHLRDELAFAITQTENGRFTSTLALAHFQDSPSFKENLSTAMEMPIEDEVEDSFYLVTDLNAPMPPLKLLIWAGNGTLIMSSDAALLKETATLALGGRNSAFTQTLFHTRLSEAYTKGVQQVLGLAVEPLTRRDANLINYLDELGFSDAEHLILQNYNLNGSNHGQASLSFKGIRRGMASWLEAPAPMGSLQFITPDASAFVSAVYKEPILMFEEFTKISKNFDTTFQSDLDQAQQLFGTDIREDALTALGGEMALALDGPVLPTPSWKMVLEVYSPQILQAAIMRFVTNLNEVDRAAGRNETFSLTSTEEDGQAFYTLNINKTNTQFVYTFIDGFLVVTPTKTLLDNTLRLRAAGSTMASSNQIAALMGADQGDVSALFYENLGSLKNLVGRLMGSETDTALTPGLAYARASDFEITFASTSADDPLGFGLLNLFGKTASSVNTQ